MENTFLHHTVERTGRSIVAAFTFVFGILICIGTDFSYVAAGLDRAGHSLAQRIAPDAAAETSKTAEAPPLPTAVPFDVLSDADKAHYRMAALLLTAGKTSEAQTELRALQDTSLVADIQALAASTPSAAAHIDSHGVSSSKTALHTMGGHWQAGLLAYRNHDMETAANHFRTLFDQSDELDSEDRAAVAFWAYRAFLAAGDAQTATYYVKQASLEQPGFYSTLARHVISETASLQEDPALHAQQVIPLMGRPEIRHVLALQEIGQDALAESALYKVFTTSEASDREKLMTLATLLNLPAAHMRMMLKMAEDTESENRGIYPIPQWTPKAGYRVDPALLFAIMRQESGFNPHAVSEGGAIGVMQLMPDTADAMARAAHLKGLSSSVPEVSMALGQVYLKRLMEAPEVGDNLVFLTAAYNAGPLNVAHWRNKLHGSDDALLFIESIPFTQTRDYVVNVLGNYWIYGQLLGGTSEPSIAALSHGEWPHYAGFIAPAAQLLNSYTIE